MKRVITGFDGSSGATAALRWAQREAELRGVELLVLTVLPPGAAESGHEDAIADGIRRAVREIAGQSPVDLRFLHGSAAAVLVAAVTGDDLLVVGTRGRNPYVGLLLGSVSRACLHHAPCPVVVVPDRPWGRHGRVIVAVDGSPHARHALRLAAEEAELRGAELQAVHAVYWDPLGAELVVPTSEELHAWGEKLVAGELDATGVKARPVVVDGHPAEVLTRFSADADLLVLGARGHTLLGDLLVGSTSDHCARHAACPVMITRA